MTIVLTVVALVVVAELGSMIALEANRSSSDAATIVINNGPGGGAVAPTDPLPNDDFVPNIPLDTRPGFTGENTCSGANPQLPNVQCITDALANVGPQAGSNVTKGYQGGLDVSHIPIIGEYWENKMCPVNVHWHLGAEHYSAGEYDETGDGPNGNNFGPNNVEGIQSGYRCKHYDADDAIFTRKYDWKHCVGMEVGETYEVHWPHSAAGACGTPNQYQTPFYDGVFCNIEKLDLTTPDATAQQIGVQAQVYTIVNDEAYYYPDMIRGMIKEGEYGADVAKYTGSTTGSARNNLVCSQYSPITWQVDRKCHLISASSFDKLCFDMKNQRDDMSGDLFPHGSRELVADELAANNHQRRLRSA